MIRHTGRNAQAGIWELNTGALTSPFQADEMCTWEGHKSGIRRESLRNCHDFLQFACLIQKLIFTRKERTCLSMSSLFSSSVQFSQSVMSNCLRPHGLQHARLPCPSPRVCSKLMLIESVMPSNCLILCLPLLLLAFNLSQHQTLFQWVASFHQVAKVLEFHLQHQSFQWLFRVDFL